MRFQFLELLDELDIIDELAAGRAGVFHVFERHLVERNLVRWDSAAQRRGWGQ